MDMLKLSLPVPITLILLFVFSVGLDFEYSVLSIKGSGEVLGQTSILIGDELQKQYEVSVPIKLMDVLTLALITLVISKRKTILSGINLSNKKDAWYRLLVAAGLYISWAMISIIINAQYYSNPQIVVMTLHLIKLLQVIFAGLMLALLMRGFEFSVASSSLLIGLILVCVILLTNRIGWINIGAVAGDRMETYGVMIIAIIIAFQAYQIEASKAKLPLIKQCLYGGFVFLGTIAILSSGKRGVALAHLVCITLLLTVGYINRNMRIKMLQYALIAGFVVSLPNVVHDFQRTTANHYDAVHGTIYREDIYNLYKIYIFNQKSLEQIRETKVPLISYLDYSGADRIGKYIKTVSLIPENLWAGSGFWGVQYKYGFLPDTGLQVLLETGLIGTVLLLLMFYWIWRGAQKSRCFRNGPAAAHVLVALVALVSLSVFCNPFYMSRLVMMWMSFAFLCVHPQLGESEND